MIRCQNLFIFMNEIWNSKRESSGDKTDCEDICSRIPECREHPVVHFKISLPQVGMSDDVTIGLRQIASSAIFATFYCFLLSK